MFVSYRAGLTLMIFSSLVCAPSPTSAPPIREGPPLVMAAIVTDRHLAGIDAHNHYPRRDHHRGRYRGIDHEFTTANTGYAAVTAFCRDRRVGSVGAEGTSSYGAGITRALVNGGITVAEVDGAASRLAAFAGVRDECPSVVVARLQDDDVVVGDVVHETFCGVDAP